MKPILLLACLTPLAVLATAPVASPQNCQGQPKPSYPIDNDKCCADEVFYTYPAGSCDLTCADAIAAIPNWAAEFALKCDQAGNGVQDAVVDHADCHDTAPGYNYRCIRGSSCQWVNQYDCDDFRCQAPYAHIKGCNWVFTGQVPRWITECDPTSTSC